MATQPVVAEQQELFPLKASSSFRDDIELMALPFFSISKTPRHLPIEHRYPVEGGGERYVRVTGGPKGIATIWDNDILIYARTLIAQKLNSRETTSNKVTFRINDFLQATGRDTGGKSYAAFKDAVTRLQTTMVFTNIAAGDYIEDSGFGWLQGFRMRKVRHSSGREVVAACELTLCDWLYNAAVADAKRILSIERSYFDLSGGLERKLWLIVRKHLGRQPWWFIGIDKLHERCASLRERRQFRHDLKKIVEGQPFAEFTLELTKEPPLHMKGARGRNLFFVAKPRKIVN